MEILANWPGSVILSLVMENLGIDIHLPTMLWTLLLSPLLIFASKILLSKLKRFTEYALEGAMYWMSRYFMRSLSAVLTLRRYCKIRLEDPRTKYLHIPATHDVTVPVDELFVPLVLENQIGTQEGFTHATLLEAGTRILVLGDPGSGKSSLLKKVFRESCSNALSTWVTPKTHLPVLVELKNLARISTLVSILLTIGWPRTPLLMRVGKHSRR